MLDAVIVVVILLALGLALLEQRQDPGRGLPRDRRELPAFCAWCSWRDSEDFTNPGSPISGQACGPVCIGEVKCGVREVEK
jgi:hypothetical protein